MGNLDTPGTLKETICFIIISLVSSRNFSRTRIPERVNGKNLVMITHLYGLDRTTFYSLRTVSVGSTIGWLEVYTLTPVDPDRSGLVGRLMCLGVLILVDSRWVGPRQVRLGTRFIYHQQNPVTQNPH